jgi:hypothetical protein
MVARVTTAILSLIAGSSDALSTRRGLLSRVSIGAAALVPAAALASGVSLEEGAKNAEKYRVKGQRCTPQNPENCTDRYNKMLDPRAGLSKAELEIIDARDAKELSTLEKMLGDVKYTADVAKKGK